MLTIFHVFNSYPSDKILGFKHTHTHQIFQVNKKFWVPSTHTLILITNLLLILITNLPISFLTGHSMLTTLLYYYHYH